MAPAGTSAPLPRWAARWGAALLLALFAASSYSQSARPAAEILLRHLANGEIEAASQLSNVPKRRLDELAKYRAAVGEEQFKQIYSSYFQPLNPLVAEIAIGAHRLLIWRLGEADNHLAGQFYVEANGQFLMDDIPSETRNKLRQMLEDYRSGKLKL